jgi:hypothetical protein
VTSHNSCGALVSKRDTICIIGFLDFAHHLVLQILGGGGGDFFLEKKRSKG